MRVLLIAIPNKVIQDYQIIAKLSGLELYALEAEAFGITRALFNGSKKIVCTVDMGVESSIINVVEGNYLRKSYSFDFGSHKLNSSIASSLKIDSKKAEELKIKEGLLSENKNFVDSISPLIDNLTSEVKNIMDHFTKEEGRTVQEVHLTGGIANMPGLKDYFKKQIDKEVFVPNCFSDISYPVSLQKSILELAPRFSAAVGVSLFRFES